MQLLNSNTKDIDLNIIFQKITNHLHNLPHLRGNNNICNISFGEENRRR